MAQLTKQCLWIGAFSLAGLVAVGCGSSGSPNSISAESKGKNIDKEMYLVKAEPAGQVGRERENMSKTARISSIVGHIGGDPILG